MFTKYASRVVHVDYQHGTVSRSFIESLRDHLPRPILPNVCSVRCIGTLEQQDCILLSLFLGSALQDIDLPRLSHAQNAASLLSDIGHSAPFLKSLTMNDNTEELDDNLIQAISDLISQSRHLAKLDVEFYPRHTIAHIARSAKLRVLKINHLNGVVLESLDASSTISEMDLTTDECPLNFYRFLCTLCPCGLCELYLTVCDTSDSSSSVDGWKQCFDTLSVYCSSTLEHLHIDHQETFIDVADWMTFRPLLTIRCLKTLLIQGFAYTLRDDDLEQMALAWPQLQSFRLLAYFATPPSPPRITLSGITTLLKHCPMLQSLGLIFDARIIDTQVITEPTDVVCNRIIKVLDVGNSPINDTMEVAKFLHGILPRLGDINTQYIDNLPHIRGLYSSQWGTVRQLLSTFQMETHRAARLGDTSD